ncbi:hypothetical protein GM661_03015 [Iocasia frigidifontis]|uniref:Uncharacterized protein n=1 Tax=Iocasia fonsfrigidae TaxID=2682810 RepID=A0A8A7KCB1_9FIRM|nr:hypothetical protein [Iocasia fonsfrigidae]QTL97019.1 hypothetical protein GM661_03015 [Iocasia fonsfrigidae]
MSGEQNLVLEKLFGMDCERELVDLIEELELSGEGELKSRSDKYETEKKIIITYEFTNKQDKNTALCIAAGLPNAHFDEAVVIYGEEIEQYGDEYIYQLEGHALAGSLVQYLGLISEGAGLNYQAKTYNSLGLENCLKFRGNEFFGYKLGLLQHIDNIVNQKESYKMNSMSLFLSALIDEGVIKYSEGEAGDYGNISSEFRKKGDERLDTNKIKGVLKKIVIEKLEKTEEEAKNLVDENFNPRIIERKMNLINNYKKYNERKEEDERIINYILSDNILAGLYQHAGIRHIIDIDFQAGRSSDELCYLLKILEEDNIDDLLESSGDLFTPFVLLTEEDNNRELINRFKKKPQLGEITNRINNEYLKALIKDIVLDIKAVDKNLIKEIFKISQRKNRTEIQEIVEDRLYYSMKERGIIKEDELHYHSYLLEQEPELFAKMKKTYPLDRAVIKQFEKMRTAEITALWEWKLSTDGIFLILGNIDSEEVIKYHSSTGVFNNQREEIKLELDQPSQNKIYGSHGKPANYQKIYDHDYHYKEEGAYNFSSKQGVGFIILSTHKNPEQGIKIDGRDISGQYEEKDREEANIGGRTKTLRDTYFGENIILRDKKTTYGQLSGDLVYIYGPQKEDELIIEGFQNGDYGITLREKVRQPEDDKQPVTYTAYHKVRFDCVEFVDLKEMVIEKSIYEHSRVKIAGVIKDENAEKYRDYLEKEADPRIIITYDDDDSKILFKGIINDYNIDYKYFNYYLELWAVSYTILLDRERHTRVYQNQGTSYNQVCQKLSTANEKFNINFARSSAGEVPLVSEQYPLVLQHKETDWEFINRIASYLDQVLIVDDTKDDNETINIQLGFHSAQAVELNNDNWAKCKDTGPKNIIYQYYKVYQHEHFRSDHVFEVGKKVKLIIDHKNNTTVEMGMIKNKIYLQKGILYSELTLAREENIKILNKQRKFLMEGRSYRAEVREVNQKHQAQVSFIDIEDDYQTDKALWFPIDKPYTAAYSSPDIGDIVDIYFRNKNEKYATLKSSTTDEAREIEQNPADKTIRIPGGYIIKLNNGSIYIASPEEEAVLEITAEEIKMTSSDNQAVIKKGEIELKNEKGYGKLSKTGSEIGFGKKKVEINNGKVKFI